MEKFPGLDPVWAICGYIAFVIFALLVGVLLNRTEKKYKIEVPPSDYSPNQLKSDLIKSTVKPAKEEKLWLS